MRNAGVVASILCLSAMTAQAASSEVKGPFEYLGALPRTPASGCRVTAEAMSAFRDKFLPVMKELSDDIGKRRRTINKWQQDNSKQMQEHAVDMPGFQGKSQAEMRKMSREEKKKMAEQIMAEKYGISMQELKEQKKAQREGKVGSNVAWAKALAGEKQGEDLMKSKGEVEAGKQKINDNIKLAKEQQGLTRTTTGLRVDMQERMIELEKDEQGVKLEQGLKREKTTLEKMISAGAPCRRLDEQNQRVRDARGQYCAYMSPRHLKALATYRVSIENSVSDHRRLDEVASQLQRNQVGVGLPDIAIGLSALETIQDYARYFKEVFKYNDGDPNAPRSSFCD